MEISTLPMQLNALGMLAQYGWYAIGFLAVAMLAYWWFDERDQTDNIADTVERVGARAEVVTGGIVGGLGSLIVVLVSIFVTIGNELVLSLNQLAPWIQMAPAMVGQVLLGLLALANLQGYVPLKPWQFGTAFIAVVLVSGLLRFTDTGGRIMGGRSAQ